MVSDWSVEMILLCVLQSLIIVVFVQWFSIIIIIETVLLSKIVVCIIKLSSTLNESEKSQSNENDRSPFPLLCSFCHTEPTPNLQIIANTKRKKIFELNNRKRNEIKRIATEWIEANFYTVCTCLSLFLSPLISFIIINTRKTWMEKIKWTKIRNAFVWMEFCVLLNFHLIFMQICLRL